MKEKVVEILVYLMSEMQEDKKITDIEIRDLKTRGYTQSEISAAFSWLYDNFDMSQGVATRAGKASAVSKRILHDVEKVVLSTESQGYLIQLREIGLLEDQDVEAVIDRAMVAGYEKLTLAELRVIVASVLIAKAGSERGLNRSMLNSKDTIH